MSIITNRNIKTLVFHPVYTRNNSTYTWVSNMKVNIKSILTEPVAGFLQIETHSCAKINSLIDAFCVKKNLEISRVNLVLYSTSHQPLHSDSTLESQGITDGATFYLGCNREVDNITAVMKWKIVAALALILSLCGLITVCLLYTLTGGKIPEDYGIVMDAGSTHTQITVYQWEGDKDEGTGDVSQVDTCKVPGGIHENLDFTKAGEKLLPCLKNATMSVPEDRYSVTPLYLGATAGMRLLNLSNSLLAEAILFAIKCTLKSTGFSIQNISIISGETEALSAWISANFLLGKLYEAKHKQIFTAGALDLGGASTQVAFEIPANNTDSNSTDVVPLKLYGKNYKIFSKSYLCFGINEALRRHYALLVDDPDRKDTFIEDPCGLHGSSINQTADFLFNQPCTTTKKIRKWLLEDEDNKDKIFTFVGTGDNQQCAKSVAEMMDNTKCKEQNYTECFEKPHHSLTDMEYVAVSTYYYVTKFLNTTNCTLSEYEQAMYSFCNSTYEEAMQSTDSEGASYINVYCYEAHYIYYLLIKGYNFNSTTWENVKFIKSISGTDVGWSLGYMINDTNAIPEEKASNPYISLSTFAILTVICILALLLAVFFLLRFYSQKSQFGYTDFSKI